METDEHAPTDTPPSEPPLVRSAPPPWWAGLAGAFAAAAALGVTELVAGLWRAESSLLVGVGDLVIDFAPPSVEDTAISLFGTNDKRALVIGILVLSVAFGWALGMLWRRRRAAAVAGFYAFGAFGAFAAIRSPFLSLTFGVVTAIAAATTGAVVLALLGGGWRGTAVGDRTAGSDRRRFLAGAGAVAALTALAAVAGRWLTARARRVVAADRAEVALPAVSEPVAPPSTAAAFDVSGISPVVTPNDEFYRIDTALVVPRPDTESWKVAITGMVETELSYTLSDLLAMPLHERYVTIACVSNPIGGDLIGNAKWTGVRLTDLLERSGVQPEATQIVGRSVDGWTAGFPTALAFDGRDPLVAIGMNDEMLPPIHGFPARLIVPGLYGYVSATKWLESIELTRWEDFDGYWIPRGWSKEGPIKTQSRIDVPRPGETVDTAAPTAIAGVAWAPTRGISRVEVRLNGGDWRNAEITTPLADTTWVQWRHQTTLDPGTDYLVEVRATDGEGATQPEERTNVAPDGATGYHGVRFRSS